MNYREKIREAISCPQFGDNHYGEWGALRPDQRKLIKRLLDDLDGADNYISYLHKNIDEITNYIKERLYFLNDDHSLYNDDVNIPDLLEKLEKL